MLAHIDFDLRMSLLTEGAGSDEAFAEMGRLVQAAWMQSRDIPGRSLNLERNSILRYGFSTRCGAVQA